MMPSFELPGEIAGPSAWYGPQVATRTDWIHTLSDEEIVEIDRAVSRLGESVDEPATRSREVFPLPTLGRRLSEILAEVLEASKHEPGIVPAVMWCALRGGRAADGVEHSQRSRGTRPSAKETMRFPKRTTASPLARRAAVFRHELPEGSGGSSRQGRECEWRADAERAR